MVPGRVLRGPLRDLGRAEAVDHAQLHHHRLAIRGDLHGCQQRRLVRRAPPALATGVLAAQIGVVQLHGALQPVALITLPHGLHELVLEQPGGVVVDAQLAPQLQGRDAALGLGEEVDGKEPNAQRQLGGLEDGAGEQGELALAVVALEGGPAGGEAAEAGAAAAGAVEAVGPAGGEEGLLALRLGAVVLEELGQAEAFLELDFVLGHSRGLSSHDYRNIFAQNQ